MSIVFHTEFSSYEMDEERQKVRRLSSAHPPTKNQGFDGEWKDYMYASLIGARVLFEFHIDVVGDKEVLRRTLTSNVISVDGDRPLDLPNYTGALNPS
jgi:hypothetical protein